MIAREPNGRWPLRTLCGASLANVHTLHDENEPVTARRMWLWGETCWNVMSARCVA